ncbi:MAG: 30S ribosomal protein S9 [Candidatus Omnitrophota bacterium]
MKKTEASTSTTGRRKKAVARVSIVSGTGEIKVNNRSLEDYFPRESLQMLIKQPLVLTEKVSKYNIHATVKGGGNAGQAGALMHGISRALMKVEPALRPTLKKAGFVTRDPRMKERKKYGQRGARAKFQWTKR